MTDWQKETADKAEGSMRSNQFEGFEAYSTAPADFEESPIVKEGEEIARGQRNIKGSLPEDHYRTV